MQTKDIIISIIFANHGIDKVGKTCDKSKQKSIQFYKFNRNRYLGTYLMLWIIATSTKSINNTYSNVDETYVYIWYINVNKMEYINTLMVYENNYQPYH